MSLQLRGNAGIWTIKAFNSIHYKYIFHREILNNFFHRALVNVGSSKLPEGTEFPFHEE